jgi:predicted dehydrogenase
VGFNRRFSAPLVAMKNFFAQRTEPMALTYRVNAGFVPPESWIQAPEQGGRIIGEACHFIDCMAFLTGAVPVSVSAEAISTPNVRSQHHDTVLLSLKFSDGSIGAVHYFANGDSAVEKEYLEAFCGGQTAIMRNFTSLELAAGKRISTHSFNGSKGHAEEMAALVAAVRRNASAHGNTNAALPIDYATLRAVTAATLAAVLSLQTGERIWL